MSDEHAHPHDHDERPTTYHERLSVALFELLVDKGIVSAADVQTEISAMEGRTPERAAQLVAHAWCDPAFKARLLADGSAAMREFGIDPGAMHLVALEDTPEVHNLIVCTLCSCYPRMLLGVPPGWYKSRAYRARVVREPRTVLAEFGVVVPEHVAVRVHDSTADMRYMVLPLRPSGTEGWSEEQLAALVTRDAMIGTGMARDSANADISEQRLAGRLP